MKIELIREKDKIFPIIESPEKVTSLKIWHCNYESMEAISELNGIERLTIATYPERDLEVISKLKRLQTLQIINMPLVDDLSPLENLPNLTVLSLQTLPSLDSSGKKTIVKSLKPIAKIGTLRHLELFGVIPASKSLSELMEMTFLQTAKFSKYPKKEMLRFFEETGVIQDWNPSLD